MEYLFCQQIDRHLCFNKNNLYCCTIGNNTKGQSLPVIKENYNGELIDWIEFFRKSEQIKQNFKNGNPLECCTGCYFLHKADWDNINETWEFKYIQLSHWQMCNSDCIYCANHINWDKNKKSDTYNSVPIIKDLLSKNYINEHSKIEFAGGEPSLYRHFNELMDLIINSKVKEIIVYSNAILYNKKIEEGIKKGTVSLCVSIDAGSKKIHEKVKQVKSFDRVWKNIKKYSKVKSPFTRNYIALKYIIIPKLNDSEEEIEKWIQKSIRAGVNMLILNADNNVFIKECSREEKLYNLRTIILLSEYFLKRMKELNIKAKFEFNIEAAYKELNYPIPSFENFFYM